MYRYVSKEDGVSRFPTAGMRDRHDARKRAADKGQFSGACNRTACQAPGATWWHMDTRAYYCVVCADLLNTIHAVDAQRLYGGPLLREHSAAETPPPSTLHGQEPKT